jgi:integrase
MRTDPILYRLSKLIHERGIPEGFTGYSIRHAVITALFGFMKETEVNAFTGHSNNSHTSLKYYYHLDKNWAGKMLADRKAQSRDLV